jgi:MFS family permease
LGVAALAMVATLPGRTHGLGLITEPLLSDLGLDRVQYGWINFGATLLGAAFCLPFGRLVDCYGTRLMLTSVAVGLGAVVLAMTGITGAAALFVTLTLTRGLGQGALSVVSQAIVGKWFVRRLQLATGVYALVLGLGFMVAFPLIGMVATHSWRLAWSGIGLLLVAVMAPIGWLLVRNSPEACGLSLEGQLEDACKPPPEENAFTLGQVVRTPAFWAFALASSLFLLMSSGTSLFGQAILQERGFDRPLFIRATVVTAFLGLACNFVGGWLATWWPMGRLMGTSMLVLAWGLLSLPLLRTDTHVYLYAAAMGASGGGVTVVFFAYWAHAFGRGNLGGITGMAQALTVLASGLGQVLPALCKTYAGSYAPLFFASAPLAALLGVYAWLVPAPDRRCPIRAALRPISQGESAYARNP